MLFRSEVELKCDVRYQESIIDRYRRIVDHNQQRIERRESRGSPITEHVPPPVPKLLDVLPNKPPPPEPVLLVLPPNADGVVELEPEPKPR